MSCRNTRDGRDSNAQAVTSSGSSGVDSSPKSRVEGSGGSVEQASASSPPPARSPWGLMGRMVSEQRIALQYDRQLNQGLVRSAAARASGLQYEEFDERLQVGACAGRQCILVETRLASCVSWSNSANVGHAEMGCWKERGGGSGPGVLAFRLPWHRPVC